MDGVDEAAALAEFSVLGLGEAVFLSAVHGRGIGALSEWLLSEPWPAAAAAAAGAAAPQPESDDGRIRVAIVGRPNVGKSTLTNRLLGEERQLVFDEPGTTRDAIATDFERGGQGYRLIDTAGVRRKGRVAGVAEKFSVVKSLQAMDEAHVVILVLDATEGLVDQDLQLLRYAVESGNGVLVAVNKWDGLDPDIKARMNRLLDRKLAFAPWVPVERISALHGTGVGVLLETVNDIYRAGSFEVATSLLTRLLTSFVAAHPPPSVRGRPIKLRFAHKAGAHPPRISIHGNQTAALPGSYVRYLENSFRDALGLVGNPVLMEFETSENPYAGRRNELTRRQQQRRKRVIRHRRR
jgi:GTP-binding protein